MGSVLYRVTSLRLTRMTLYVPLSVVGLFGLLFITIIGSELAAGVTGICMFVFAAVALRRATQLSINATESGVKVTGWFRSWDVPWSDVAGIEIRRAPSAHPAVTLAIRRRDGSEVFTVGVSASTLIRPHTFMDQAAEELRRLLAAHTTPPPDRAR